MGFSRKDKWRFIRVLVEKWNDTLEQAMDKANVSIKEAIEIHDNILPDRYQVKEITIQNKKYRYVGNGHFRRIDKLGRFIIDGKSSQVNGAKRIGLYMNPLQFVFNIISKVNGE